MICSGEILYVSDSEFVNNCDEDSDENSDTKICKTSDIPNISQFSNHISQNISTNICHDSSELYSGAYYKSDSWCEIDEQPQ